MGSFADLVIIKYNAGNIRSVLYALERLGQEALVTDDPEEIQRASRVIFPGVGEASSAMAYLKERKMDALLKGLRQPVLGICLGMQLMCRHSEENDTSCLGIFDTEVQKFYSPDNTLKIPQIGWNEITHLHGPLMQGLPSPAFCYFVHSYYALPCDQTIAQTEYSLPFSSALQKNNFYGVQFHPEKSAGVGEQILKNFLAIPSKIYA